MDICIILMTTSTLVVTVRILMGPSLPDRVVAADGATTHVIALSVLVGMKLRSMTLFDVAIALSILSFLTAVVVGKYLEKGHIIDDVGNR